MSAFLGGHWNLHLALRAVLRRWIGRNLAALDACHQCVHRRDDEVVDRYGDQQERDQGVEKVAVGDVGTVNR